MTEQNVDKTTSENTESPETNEVQEASVTAQPAEEIDETAAIEASAEPETVAEVSESETEEPISADKVEETVEGEVSEPPAAVTQEPAAASAKATTSQRDDDDDDDAPRSEKSFEELLDEYDQYRRYHAGDIVDGTVVSVGDNEVLLDIGARVEGAIPRSELLDENGELVAKYGDKLRVMVCRYGKDAQYVPLSFERARVSHIWDDIESIATNGETIEGLIVEKVKGGFIVDIGVRAFLPTSLATLRPQKDYQELIGLKAPFEITKLQRRRGNVILSRKELLRKEFEEGRAHLLEHLEEGAVLEGRVKNITDYGAFVDLGGLDGLLHITDMSWGRVNHPSEMLEVGQELNVKVLRLDKENDKVSLGLKQIIPDPWLSAPETYARGKTVTGKVLNLTGFGAFIELEPGVEGLVHVSELSWTKKVRNPAQVLKKGDEVRVRVLDIDIENRKVSLSVRQTDENPWDSLANRFPVGSKVRGKVRNITEFGAFVEIEEGIDGLVHISDFQWGERAAKPEDHVTKGEEVEVVVLAVDSENHKVSLGIKQLLADPWLAYSNEHREGQVIQATVTKVSDAGLNVQLSEHVEGFIRAAETGVERGKRLSDVFSENQEIQALVTRISNRERRVDLSIRRMHQQQERRAVEEYTQGQDQGGATLGDIMKHLVK
ncbi:MAG: 30S ribosomal protein S1 [Acidobacteria bacterium]|nr:30S ribosomal protein S1 [Acidobacteriota bacterium]